MSRPWHATFAIFVAIAGVLLALALPRWLQVHEGARHAQLQRTVAAVRAAAALFHARCAAAHGGAACDRMSMDGVPITGAYGWPAASAEGIVRAASLEVPAAGLVLQHAQAGAVPSLRVRVGPQAGCEFVYVQAAAPGDVPRVDIVDASCP